MSTPTMELPLSPLDWPQPLACRPTTYLRDRANYLTPRLPALLFSSSPSTSDSSSSLSTADMTISPPEPASPIRLSVCDVPVVAPRPLPYHSPTFLQFDLPDTDEDLSHPPYTHRPAKRKRDDKNDKDPKIHDDLPSPPPAKRRVHHIHAWRSRVCREHQLPLRQLHSPYHQRQLLHHHVSLRPPPLASTNKSSGFSFSADQPLGWHHHP
ncbi:hypothetical protein V8B97DRAFT_2005618 [Scleroderma yunnanense]